MPFTETTKLEVKRRAAFRCCRCHEIGVDIHHILPQHAGGSDDVDNAAPLCQNCHDRFGDNPQKRKEIRLMRDWWYDVVVEKYGPSNSPQVNVVELNPDIRSYLDRNFRLLTSLLKKHEGPQPTSPKSNAQFPATVYDPDKLKQYVTVDDVADDKAFAIEVKGKSMEPRISDGDLIIVSPSAKVSDGDICVIRVQDEDTVKVVKFQDGYVSLIPLNPSFEPMVVRRRDVTFIWKVIKVIAGL